MGVIGVTFQAAAPGDLERLTALKLLVMNPQLARIGRLDEARSAGRFAAEFRPDGGTRLILADGEFAGCVTLRPGDDAWVLEHLYLLPEFQGRGIAAAAMTLLLAEADAAAADIVLSVLLDGDALGFYDRHGFQETHREAFDVYFRRSATTQLTPKMACHPPACPGDPFVCRR